MLTRRLLFEDQVIIIPWVGLGKYYLHWNTYCEKTVSLATIAEKPFLQRWVEGKETSVQSAFTVSSHSFTLAILARNFALLELLGEALQSLS